MPSEYAVASMYSAERMSFARSNMDPNHRRSFHKDPVFTTPTFFLHLPLDSKRVAACRDRFSLMIERQLADVARVKTEKKNDPDRTNSPVSVVPRDARVAT